MQFISLEEAKKIKLDKRYCTKYVITREMFNCLLPYLERNFRIVKDEKNEIILSYHSVYFDTPKFQMNKDHIEHKLHRQKIRIREYSSGEKFLEIKDKNNHITTKKRIPVNSYEIDNQKQWISDNLIYDTKDLNKKLDVFFYRVTLVDEKNTYRITLDFNISFFNYETNKSYRFDKSVLEVKKTSSEEVLFEKEIKARLIENWPDFSSSKFSKYNFGLDKTK